MLIRISLVLGLALAACEGNNNSAVDGATIDSAVNRADARPGCDRPFAEPDRARKLVVSRPFAGGNDSTQFEVLDVDNKGTITRPGVTFDMGRTTDGRIVFTRDGEVGMVAQNDGTVGVFRFDSSGNPVVVHAGFDAGGADGFWASSVVMGPTSHVAYVLNSQWRTNGGGVYVVAIECDSTLTYLGLLAASKLPYAMEPLPNGNMALAADDLLDSMVTNGNAYLSNLHGGSVLAGIDVFGDDEAIVGSAASTYDGRWFLLGDVSSFSQIAGDRIGVVEIGDSSLTATHVIPNIPDPFDMVSTPWDHYTTLVSSGFGDALYALNYNGGAPEAPFEPVEVTYNGDGPQLPGSIALIRRGPLKGYAFVAENQGVRQLRFLQAGPLSDLGLVSFGTGNEFITGAIGVQP